MRILIAFAFLLAIVCAQNSPLSQTMIDKINSMQSSWKAGHNFIGQSMAYVKNLMGTFLDTPAYLKLPYKPIVPIEGSIPTTFDART